MVFGSLRMSAWGLVCNSVSQLVCRWASSKVLQLDYGLAQETVRRLVRRLV